MKTVVWAACVLSVIATLYVVATPVFSDSGAEVFGVRVTAGERNVVLAGAWAVTAGLLITWLLMPRERTGK